jgi:BMFP domain-containing protein YqiC
MSEDKTAETKDSRSFEERVFARFDVVEGRLSNVEIRIGKLEDRQYDTKPIWENALKEIVDTRREVTRRLDRIEAMVLETRAGLSEAEDRLDRLESRPG